ncbi:sodium-dependent transporter [Campylobacter hyointestinalis]|uniref:sodium-dependent transporter n=1 Tax=Campylobacter hyointestinalis TaxID=198 RepID=UPI000CE4A770|nr:sodium-dependent transporter [Campylobacter hyointestinalis]PPB67017.1 sodium-dependent transporter [Campylobacter hyointestinalis subsp. hyointestinalis]
MIEKFSKIGFVLAMAGSAVGLGNAWKFPTMVGNNGGSAFILLYIVLTLGIAVVVFLAELSIGKLGESDLVSSLHKLAPNHKKQWSLAGFFMITAVLIASFYMIVIGWILKYTFMSFGSLPKDAASAGETFGNLVTNDLLSVFICFSIVFLIVFYVVSKGIKSGIEKLNLWMMPSLFVLLILLLLYAIFESGRFGDALSFIFIPDFSKILNPTIILQALGLAFFSMSMGVGTVSTYAASLPDGTNLVKSTFSIVFINILIGIMMGLVVFSFIPIVDGQPASEGAGLIFVSLASLFAQMGLVGNFLAVLFFVSLLFAGITSAVSMIEPFTLYLINKFKFTRKKALITIGIVVYILGLFCIFSYYGTTSNLFSLPKELLNTQKPIPFFDVLDFMTSNVLMPLGAITFSIFVGWVLKREGIYILFSGFMSKNVFEIWYFTLRFVAPMAILAIGVYQLIVKLS